MCFWRRPYASSWQHQEITGALWRRVLKAARDSLRQRWPAAYYRAENNGVPEVPCISAGSNGISRGDQPALAGKAASGARRQLYQNHHRREKPSRTAAAP